MSTRSLPSRPSLAQLKIQADELHRSLRAGQRGAAARVAGHHPRFRDQPLQVILSQRLALADAQLTLAREYGFQTWAQLKQRVELGPRIAQVPRHPRFDDALAALDAGDGPALRALVAADPSLVRARTNLEPPYGYFTGATLLHHVAGNPGRDHPLPPGIVELTAILLDAGADVNATTLGPAPSNSPETRGASTMDLVVTSKQASDMGVAAALIDLLLSRGAAFDLTDPAVLDASLTHHAPGAAEKLIALGARVDLFAAAGLGRIDWLAGFFDVGGRLLSAPIRNGAVMSDRDAIGLAMLFAYVRHQPAAVEFLIEKDGNWNMTGVANGTALHRAAWNGDLAMVQRLVAKRADINNRDHQFSGTPLHWAHYNGKMDVVRWIQEHAAVDLATAVAFDWRDQLIARLDEEPASVNERVDDGHIPRGTALHAAARLNRAAAAAILLARGADPNLLTGDGRTALDVADAYGSTAVAALLEDRGATRTPAAPVPDADPKMAAFEALAADVLDASDTGDPDALARIGRAFNRHVTQHDVRRAVALHSGKEPADATLDDARQTVARFRGFESWATFAESVARPGSRSRTWGSPLYRLDSRDRKIMVRTGLEPADWDEILQVMADEAITTLAANGQMSDDVIARVAELEAVTSLELEGSRNLTDAGLKHLRRLPRLQHLNLSGCSFTDRGLEVLGSLQQLRSFSLFWHQHVSDEGLAHLAECERLERVDLLGTPAGDGTVAALTGKPLLKHLKTGTRVTDAGLAHLTEFPAFRNRHNDPVQYSLMSFDVESHFLLLDGPFTNAGCAPLRQLHGLSGLSFFWHATAFTAAGLREFADLPQLVFLGCDGARCTDEAMQHIARMPGLRMLMAQGAVATDDGFVALSRSKTLEHLWGRECDRLTGRGFAALADLPTLRGLAVSCARVDDAALARLPQFPGLQQLMPMDVSDHGFRHVGRCEQLERLWCMYCRDTTDVATEHIGGLRHLREYYAGKTRITDRSLEILSRMTSLEKINLWEIAGVTTAGIARLATLPRLQELTIDGMPQIAREAAAMFAPTVRVTISG